MTCARKPAFDAHSPCIVCGADRPGMSPKTTTTRVTSSQVATLAGVSRTTASFVLNDVPHMGISEETRERVLSAARQLGYVPNAAARSLVSGATRTVAIVTPHSEHLKVDAFIPRMLAGVNGFPLVVFGSKLVEHTNIYRHSLLNVPLIIRDSCRSAVGRTAPASAG
jgi:hypothetical protein